MDLAEYERQTPANVSSGCLESGLNQRDRWIEAREKRANACYGVLPGRLTGRHANSEPEGVSVPWRPDNPTAKVLGAALGCPVSS
jgi:hypothetical protein